MRFLLRNLGVWILAAHCTLWCQADVVKPVRGQPIVGKVQQEGEGGTVLNIYRTGLARVTLGTQRLEAKTVKSITKDPDPHRRFWTRAKELQGGTAEEWVQLGLEARTQKLKGLAQHAFVEALVRDPTHSAATKELGAQAKALAASNPLINAALAEKLKAFLAAEDAKARLVAMTECVTRGANFPPQMFDRAWRSARAPSGLKEDLRLSVDAKLHPQAVYTLFVPKSYDPFRATPLVLGLHGGGPAGKDRSGVVGSGKSTMNFYSGAAERLGWIVVCPTALRAPWSEPENDAFVLAVLDEIQYLYNIDRNRIYLAGHSMGGYGTWHFGPKYAHLFAAISPNAGGGQPNLSRLAETQTGIYCYHGANDEVVGADNDRALAKQMLDRGQDFVYCEIPDSGHGWPDDVREEMWEFFSLRRLAVAPGRGDKGKFAISEEPLSSFMEKPSKRELEAFGTIGGSDNSANAASDHKALLAELSAGGARAEKAAPKIAATKDAKLALDVGKILSDEKQSPDSRRFAAEALGGLEQISALKPLRRAMLDDALPVAKAAGIAVGRLKDPEASKSFRAGIEDLEKSYGAKKSGSKMDYTDFEAHLSVATGFAEGLGFVGDPELAPRLESLAEIFLFSPVSVDASERAGHRPEVPRRALAVAICGAAKSLNTGKLRPLLSRLMETPTLGVSEQAAEALAGLPPL